MTGAERLRSHGVRDSSEFRAMASVLDEVYRDTAAVRKKMAQGLGTVDHVTTFSAELAGESAPGVTINASAGAVVNIYTGGADTARLDELESRVVSLAQSVEEMQGQVNELKDDLATRLTQLQAQVDAAVAALAADTADVAAAQTALDALGAGIGDLVTLVGDADGDGNPAPAVPE